LAITVRTLFADKDDVLLVQRRVISASSVWHASSTLT
jgi:hypothetical protein